MKNQFTYNISKLFERDLNALKKNISSYENEEDMWKVSGEIKNSGGNLTLHIVGNLRHFVGHILGGRDYKRNREVEFSSKNISKEKMIEEIYLTIEEVKKILENLSDTDLGKNYPLEVMGYEMTTEYFLMHLYGHLNYHLGQINYHCRLINQLRTDIE